MIAFIGVSVLHTARTHAAAHTTGEASGLGLGGVVCPLIRKLAVGDSEGKRIVAAVGCEIIGFCVVGGFLSLLGCAFIDEELNLLVVCFGGVGVVVIFGSAAVYGGMRFGIDPNVVGIGIIILYGIIILIARKTDIVGIRRIRRYLF